MNRTVSLHTNRFLALLADSVRLYELSAHEENNSIKNTLANASILSTICTLEAAANGFLESIEFSSHIKKQTEKFSTLDKFDFVLQWHKDIPLPRGEKETQAIASLISQRNDLVHPKIVRKNISVQTQASKGPIKYFHNEVPNESRRTQKSISGINEDPDGRLNYDAQTALINLTKFLNRYVTEWWEISHTDCAPLLLPRFEGTINANPSMYNVNDVRTILNNNHYLEVKFIGLYGILDPLESSEINIPKKHEV